MPIKTEIALSDDQLPYAQTMVEAGRYPSIDSVVAASLEAMMMADKTQPSQAGDPVFAMADELRRRAALPRDQAIAWDQEAILDRVTGRRARPGFNPASPCIPPSPGP
ncbi:hypothetical protein [Rhizobium rhizosphaerae]|uniref:hypothetical protein n=1 Tax=Xaviernesmea rhizosphaerae TaxID=1672749 RepID=UPI001119F919|nr:hypothetical protein [Xaviernesmea rhizosphaerae]